MALELRPNCEYCDKDLPPGVDRGADLHLRVHLLRRLRRARASERLPQLRRRLRAAADPAGDGVAARPLAGRAPGVARARAPVLLARGHGRALGSAQGRPARGALAEPEVLLERTDQLSALAEPSTRSPPVGPGRWSSSGARRASARPLCCGRSAISGATRRGSSGAPATALLTPGPLGPLFDVAETDAAASSRSSSRATLGRTRSPARSSASWPADAPTVSCSRTSTGPTRRRSTWCACSARKVEARAHARPRQLPRRRARPRAPAHARARGAGARRERSRGSRSRRSRSGRSASWPSRTGSMRSSCIAGPTATRSTSPRCSRRATGEIPATVRDAVLARLARLSAPARSLLEAIAIVTPHGRGVAARGAGARRARRTSRSAWPRGCVASQSDGVAFRHELARLAVEEALPPHRRVALHRAATAALAGRPGGAADPARLAHHADVAGDGAAVLRFAPAAARAPRRSGRIAKLPPSTRGRCATPTRSRPRSRPRCSSVVPTRAT